MSTRQTATLLLLAAVASSAAAQSLMLQTGQVVQAVNDPVPSMAPGVVIGGTSPFGLPVIDLDGNMLWRAKMTGGTITVGADDQALFFGRTANDLQMLVQRGQAEPSGTLTGVTVTYSATGWDAARLSPENKWMMFGSTLAGTGITTANDTCIYWGQAGGQLFLLAQEGGPTPASTAGATISGNISGAQNVTALNSSGTAVIKVNMAGGNVVAGASDTAWLIGSLLTGMNIMCRESDPVAGFQVSATLDGFKPEIDELGRVLFAQNLLIGSGSPAVTASDDGTMMLYTPVSGLSIVMREGSPAPGSGGCLFGGISSGSGFSNHAFSRTSGRFVFTNSITGGDVTGTTTDTSIFAGQIGGSIARIAREAEAAPTGVPGDIYQALFPSGTAQINESGTVVFVALLGNPTNPGSITLFNDVGVFLARPPYGPGDVQLILREGDTSATIAGLPSGWAVGNTSGAGMSASTATTTSMMLNERDTVLINVGGVGDPLAPTWGVPAQIAWDAEHGLRLANLQGEVYTIQAVSQVQSSAMGTVATGSGDGGNQSFNNNGDQCARVFFAGTVATAIMRNHVGSLDCGPSAVSTLLGGVHTMLLDAGPSHAGRLYVVGANATGTRPGTSFGIETIPLNADWLLTESINSLSFFGVPPWSATLGNLDVNGRATVTLTVPPNVTQFAGLNVHHAFLAADLALNVFHVSEPCGMLAY